MGGKVSPEYWRAYRLRNRERLNKQEAIRRRNASLEKKQARHRAEVLRRRRRRQEDNLEEIPTVTSQMRGSYYDLCRTYLDKKSFSPGNIYQFAWELDYEDLMQEGAIALLEGVNVSDVIKNFRGWLKKVRGNEAPVPREQVIDTIRAFQIIRFP